MEALILGIAGGTGSGKTTLLKALKEQFGDRITVLSHDNYYRAHDEMPLEERANLNYDHPDALQTELMVEHLRLLKQGIAIECPTYDYALHTRAKEVIVIEPRPVIVVEGILIFADKTLRELMDFKIFIDADADVRLARRVKRDVRKRGRELESVLIQYLTTVKPMHEQFVEPSKKNADLVVLEGGKNLPAREIIFQYIESRLQERE